jgi:2-C-methyl-D-erythritol 4-phosphate cytidylyltransferase
MTLATAIIVAGGKGLRMQSDIRKQYLKLGKLPILSHTILAVDACPAITHINLVIPESDQLFCEKNILSPIDCRAPINLVPGGETRQESVYKGLVSIVKSDGIVVIHDGVRPFVTVDQVNRCIEGADSHGACILGIPLKETLKSCDSHAMIEHTIERNGLWLAQTPQAFQFDLIKKAHDIALSEKFQSTDDASLIEHIGHPVKIIAGNPYNIKITTPDDFILAKSLLLQLING